MGILSPYLVPVKSFLSFLLLIILKSPDVSMLVINIYIMLDFSISFTLFLLIWKNGTTETVADFNWLIAAFTEYFPRNRNFVCLSSFFWNFQTILAYLSNKITCSKLTCKLLVMWPYLDRVAAKKTFQLTIAIAGETNSW